MSDPSTSKIGRVGELPRDIAPPHEGWPALEGILRGRAGQPHGDGPVRRWRPKLTRIAAVAAVLAAVAVGVSIDRWILSPAASAPQKVAASDTGMVGGRLTVAYITDPRYLRAREALLRDLSARVAKLPPPARKQVLQSLAAIHQSMRQIQQALGREPGNMLLQELLIDTYQDEMQVLSTVQEASGGGGEI